MGSLISETKGFTSDSAKVYVMVEQINKRSLGKLIVKVVGHEGCKNAKVEQVLRRQIQTCITHIDNYSQDTWADARVTFLGMDGSAYVIQSGDGKKRFIVRLDARDKIKFVDFQKLSKS
ncbi:uncharacterized protein LOC124272595 [Haliotis rubra]|uniref:uncharacterized protein LOC124272595 n=1 Tax=Haliotis rubra TaxID=36100 RepID=UPI001EE4ED7D|nr:uncharacterized protein LOC124272595 [Haliotis rubra]